MKLNRRFRKFLRDEVNLNQDRLRRLHTSVRDVNRYLRGQLAGYQRIDRQGSYGLDTLIKPVRDDDEYDADIQVVMNPNPNWGARDYLQALRDTLAENPNYSDKIGATHPLRHPHLRSPVSLGRGSPHHGRGYTLHLQWGGELL